MCLISNESHNFIQIISVPVRDFCYWADFRTETANNSTCGNDSLRLCYFDASCATFIPASQFKDAALKTNFAVSCSV
jgi:hypothetical protein